VRKAVNMAKQMNIKVLGLVENMSYVECPKCSEKIEIYGKSHADDIALKEGISLLGRVPIELGVSDLVDEGRIEEVQIKEFDEIVKKIM
jgi:Mrp family chromosome partitioning ATPase